MSDISTGTLSQSGSTIFISGTTSGLNTSALIEAAVAQKTYKADQIDIQIEDNTALKGAYDELQSLSQAVQSSLEALSGSTSLLDEGTSVFGALAPYATTSDGSDSTAIASITVDNNADIGSYDIEVLQEAQAMKVRGSSYADPAAALGYTGTFDLGLAGGSTATINVSATDTLQDVASAINDEAATTGVNASVLKVSETEYQLVLTGQETNKAIEVTNVTGDDVMNQTGVTDGVGGFNNIILNAREAQIEVDGVLITRDDNLFDDVLAGVNITVNNAAPGTIITLGVDNDAQAVKDAIVNFIESYNALRDFITQNEQVDSSGNVSEDALLFGDNLVSQLSFDTGDIVGADYSANSAVIATIRDLGITLDDQNNLVISDETALDNMLLNNYDDIQAFFASNATSDNAQFRMVTNNSQFASQDIVFDITTDGGGNITGVTANGDASAFTVDGTRLIGAAGTQYEGLTFSYVGTTSTTINASVKQGFANLLDQKINGYADVVTGLIQTQKADLEDANTKLSQEAQDIRDRAESYREKQIEKYAKLESDLERLRLIKNQLSALLGNTNNDDN